MTFINLTSAPQSQPRKKRPECYKEAGIAVVGAAPTISENTVSDFAKDTPAFSASRSSVPSVVKPVPSHYAMPYYIPQFGNMPYPTQAFSAPTASPYPPQEYLHYSSYAYPQSSYSYFPQSYMPPPYSLPPSHLPPYLSPLQRNYIRLRPQKLQVVIPKVYDCRQFYGPRCDLSGLLSGSDLCISSNAVTDVWFLGWNIL